MLLNFYYLLLAWLPGPIFALAAGIVTLFFLAALLHMVAFILDIIPFL